VGNFDISDHMLCPKGVHFDICFVKITHPLPRPHPPLWVNIDRYIMKVAGIIGISL
jgi:hypothetical protein